MGSSKDKLDAKGRLKVECKICSCWFHRLDVHLTKKHSMTVESYQKTYPGSEILSATAKELGHKDKAVNKTSKKKQAEKAEKPAPVDSDSFSIGVANLKMRKDLTELDKIDVPEHDDNWCVDQVGLEMWEDIAVGVEDNEPIYIGGPTGCGKTASAEALATVINQPVKRIQLTRDFKVAQFVGRPELKIDADGNQYTEFKYGVLPTAIKNGHWLILDEIDQAHPDVLMAIQAVLEGKPLVLTENFGEVISTKESERSKNFRIIATANTLGKGDDTGLYVGAKIMNEATLDRFGVTIKAKYPTKDSEVKILVKKSGVEEEVALRMVTIAHKVREAFDKEECGCTFSTRRLIMWAKKTVRYGDIRRASKTSVLNKLDTDDGRFVNDLIQRHFGGEVS